MSNSKANYFSEIQWCDVECTFSGTVNDIHCMHVPLIGQFSITRL